MSDPPQAVNQFFHGAHHFSMKDVQLNEITTTIHIHVDPPPETTLPPLAPLKHSSIFFIGRDEYLKSLKDHFTTHVEGQRKSFLLYGMGGIGKTQICLKFIEQNHDWFSDIYWIDASSEATIELGLMQIAKANNAPKEATQSPGSALNWIAQRPKWLMVYDNADGHYSVVEKYLPPGNEGNILITSRNVGLKRLTLDAENVLDMPEDEAISLLLKAAMLAGTSHKVKDVAKKVVLQLGGVPLALDQAGAYIQSCGCTIDDYLELYGKHKDELMSSNEFKGASGYGTSTYGTWNISMKQIESMAANGNGQEAKAAQTAIKLLRIFAFLNPEKIPVELFKNAAENYIKGDADKGSDSLLDHQTLFLREDGEWDRLRFLGGIQVLLSFSLIKSLGHLYSMHLLVNAWSRNLISNKEITNHYLRARALLSCSIVPDWLMDNYEFCKLVAPHLESILLHSSEFWVQEKYYDSEYNRFTLVFFHVGNWNEAEKVLNVAINDRKIRLGKDHPDTLKTMTSLASTYHGQGRWNEAEKFEVEVLSILKGKMAVDHSFTLQVMHDLALIYLDQGKWSDAEKLQVVVVNERKEVLGSDHPDTLSTMHILASTYWKQGRWDEAEKLNVDVMDARKAKIGSDHPDTLDTMQNLATIYLSQGRWNEAEKLVVHVMNANKEKLGLDHPKTLTTMHNLASAYHNQGKLEEAEKLGMQVMNARKVKLGSDHPDTLSSMHNVATTYQNQGRWQEAEQLEVDVINASKTKLGTEHPFTLTAMASLGMTYVNMGRWEEALSLLSHTIQPMQKVMGPQNPIVQTVLHYTEQLDALVKTAQQDYIQTEQKPSEPLENQEPVQVPGQTGPQPSQQEPVQVPEQTGPQPNQLEITHVVPSNSGKEDLAVHPQKDKFMRGLKGMWKKMKH
ncbi:hypothetical protein F5887DRAFT_1185023 [Amanita rubescens]|nr:hypothetical protein F5887DRAFT_1185023 [Amanita rubescens]